MPIFHMLRKLACCAAPAREEMEDDPERAPLLQPDPEPVAAGPVQAGRPHRAYVENEARRYWEEMVEAGNLSKPDRQELRAAALPLLCRAQRNRPGPKLEPALERARVAVNAVQLHLVESRRLKHPFTPTEAMPNHVEALVQLAADTGRLAREIPLPDHPAPRHPPIYYTIDPVSGKPVPRSDAKIRGDYVYTRYQRRITEDEYIYPWPDPECWPLPDDLLSRDWDACYTLNSPRTMPMYVLLHWRNPADPTSMFREQLSLLLFSPSSQARHM